MLARYSTGDPNSDKHSEQYDRYGPGVVVAIGRADNMPVAGVRFWDDEQDQLKLENIVLGSEHMYDMTTRCLTKETNGIIVSATARVFTDEARNYTHLLAQTSLQISSPEAQCGVLTHTLLRM